MPTSGSIWARGRCRRWLVLGALLNTVACWVFWSHVAHSPAVTPRHGSTDDLDSAPDETPAFKTAEGNTHRFGVPYMNGTANRHHPDVPQDGVFRAGSVGTLLEPARRMCRDMVYIQVFVCSSFERRELRDAIRSTWGEFGRISDFQFRVIFVLGQPVEEFAHLTPEVQRESKDHGDILQLDVIDTYQTLSHKTLAALAWLRAKCSRPVFVLKTDDDVFINTVNLVAELTSLGVSNQVMFGYAIENAKPATDRSSRWYMPANLVKFKTYPTYLSGSAYVISSDLVEPLLNASSSTPLFWLEDVFVTGVLAKNVNARLVHTQKILYRRRQRLDTCDLQEIISVHEMTAYDLHRSWELLKLPTHECVLGASNVHLNAGPLTES